MAKGAVAKEFIKEKLLETFEGSFVYNNGKEVRIPYEENGELVQIKISMTCAKEPVSIGGTNADMKAAAAPSETGPVLNESVPTKLAEPSEEEKQNVEDLLAALGLN